MIRASRNPSARLLVATLVAGAMALAPGGIARADIKEACASAYEQGQLLRRENKLMLARAQLAICQQACPAELTGDCKRWSDEIDAISPSVILEAQDKNGRRLDDVRVALDGKPFAARLDGAPIMVDPGTHTFRFETAGAAAREQTVDLRAEEKSRRVSVAFPDVVGPEPAPAPRPAQPSPPRSAPAPDATSGMSVAAYALAATGVIGLGAGAVLGIKGHVERSDLESNCAPHCKQKDVDAIQREWTAGAVTAAAGVVLVGIAIGILVLKPGPSAAAQRTLVLQPSRGGQPSLGVRF
jgi:hypothetical protein